MRTLYELPASTPDLSLGDPLQIVINFNVLLQKCKVFHLLKEQSAIYCTLTLFSELIDWIYFMRKISVFLLTVLAAFSIHSSGVYATEADTATVENVSDHTEETLDNSAEESDITESTTSEDSSETSETDDKTEPSAEKNTADDGLHGWPKAPDVSSGAAILMDADTGAVLYEENAKERNYPASTTKIMTGLLVARNSALSEDVTFSGEASGSVEEGDATLYMKTGETISVDQALHGLLLYSANEVAYGLAEHVSGTLDDFVDLMNKTAKEAGTLDTHFANASGLFDEDHYSTVYDMALIARMCFNNPTFLAIDSETNYTIPATNKTDSPRSFQNRNLLLPGRDYGYDYCVGGKTGYVPEGGHTYVAYAEKNGMRLIAVCFKSTADERFTDAKNLFEWGFNNFSKVSLTGTGLVAPYSGSTLIDSERYDTYKINRDFTGTFVTLPTSASLADIDVITDEDYGVKTEEGHVNIPVIFSYDGHTAGTAQLSFKSAAADNANVSQLPIRAVEKTEDTVKPIVNKAFVIDLRILIGIGAALLGIYFIFLAKNRGSERRARKKQLQKRKRKFYSN